MNTCVGKTPRVWVIPKVVQKVPSHSPPLALGDYVRNEYIKTNYISTAIIVVLLLLYRSSLIPVPTV